MRLSDWVVCGFFAYLIAVARARPVSARTRLRVLLVSVVCAGSAVLLAQLTLSPLLRIIRDWLPGVYLLQGYWLCGRFWSGSMYGVEERLARADEWLFNALGGREWGARVPRAALETLELTYLAAYPLVAAGLIVVLQSGSQAAIDRYWTAVLVAGYACFGVLPWIQTRPPRMMTADQPYGDRPVVVRRLNHLVLDRGSVQVNTFPSGHASTTMAAALAVAEVDPAAGVLVGILALGVAVSAVAGRYHFAADVLLGLLIGWGAWWAGGFFSYGRP